jgi:hypothetical protein
VLLSLVVVAASSACTQGPRDPQVVGVVETSDRVSPRTYRYALTGGRALEIDYDKTRELFPGPGLDPGDLLLYGVDDNGPWYEAVDREGDCFALYSRGTDAGNFIIFAGNLRLPKAANFDPDVIPQSESLTPFCVDGEGRVLSGILVR